MVNPSLRLLIVDDHNLMRQGLKLLLQEGPWPGFEQVEISLAGNLAECKDLLQSFQPELALIRMNPHNENTSILFEQLKPLSPNLKALLISEHPDGQYRTDFLRLGAKGYVSQKLSPEHLIPALMSIYYGGYYCNQICSLDTCQRQGDPLGAKALALLSKRELEVLKLIAEDHSREEIAQLLDISVRTVDTYRTRLLKKLNLQSSVGLTRFAIEQGISQMTGKSSFQSQQAAVCCSPPSDPFSNHPRHLHSV